jgi:ArsR family transcriptional regulator
MTSYDTQAKFFKALSHPARLAILDALRQGEQCVCHLEVVLGYRQPYISQHLIVLREAGIVQDRRDGWNVFYRVIEPGVFEVLKVVRESDGSQSTLPDRFEHCPCPHCNPQPEAVVS